ncbi:MFS transporter [Paraburkholderia sp.]|uniref:MFS transporter n=1 Tax=Paraburkholderia sp. TaxID=1926495 RepID=UPI00239C6814|nr:MFS transporter [Paraburkholderia sp.]MDE1184766.1 MFS transporter [Paraburkholderia sp.]
MANETLISGGASDDPAAIPPATLRVKSDRPLKKIVVAIHGVGSQQRSATIRTVASCLGRLDKPPLPVMPLGFFSVGNADEVHVCQLDVPRQHVLWNVGFAEVYWADVPRGVVTMGDTLEESKAWGSTIVGRAQALYRSSLDPSVPKLTDDDFSLASGVTEEIIEAVAVMENLLWTAGKAGIFKFDLGSLLTDYIGDVQLVAEFERYRKQIVNRFHLALTQIVARFYEHAENNEEPEIYVIAHSEGTVISFLAMLQALAAQAALPGDTDVPRVESGATPGHQWIRHVRGFMTIGSPIDKHLLLWPKLWPNEPFTSQAIVRPIRWRNYYDYADPIGFELDTARQYLGERRCGAFEFRQHDDFGFSRYWFPGKAHNDYWTDRKLFRHFLDDVVLADEPRSTEAEADRQEARPAKPVGAPKSKALPAAFSLVVPYLLCFVLHLAAVYVMFKAVTTFLWPDDHPWSLHEVFTSVVALAFLLTAETVAGRLPRLVKRSTPKWWLLAVAVFVVGVAVCLLMLPVKVVTFLSAPLAGFPGLADVFGDGTGNAVLILASAAIALVCWLIPRKPGWGRRTMVGLGTAFVAVAVGYAYWFKVSSDGPGAKLWPLVLSALLFIYLWWLGILLFDLAFIWHRYIRNSVALKSIRRWRNNRPAAAPPAAQPGGNR